MRAYFVTAFVVLYFIVSNADAGSICSTLENYDGPEQQELVDLYLEVCRASPGEFKGVFVSTRHGKVPVPSIFSISVSDIRHLYFTALHGIRPAGWDYGALIVMRGERIDEVARDSVEYLHHAFTDDLRSKCGREISLRRYSQAIPGGKHRMTFNELLIEDLSFHLAGESNALLRAMAESYSRLNCLPDN